MADVKISNLPAADALGAGDVFPVVQGGVTKKASISQLCVLTTDENGNYVITSVGLLLKDEDGNTRASIDAYGIIHAIAVYAGASRFDESYLLIQDGPQLSGGTVTNALTMPNYWKINGDGYDTYVGSAGALRFCQRAVPGSSIEAVGMPNVPNNWQGLTVGDVYRFPDSDTLKVMTANTRGVELKAVLFGGTAYDKVAVITLAALETADWSLTSFTIGEAVFTHQTEVTFDSGGVIFFSEGNGNNPAIGSAITATAYPVGFEALKQHGESADFIMDTLDIPMPSVKAAASGYDEDSNPILVPTIVVIAASGDISMFDWSATTVTVNGVTYVYTQMAEGAVVFYNDAASAYASDAEYTVSNLPALFVGVIPASGTLNGAVVVN